MANKKFILALCALYIAGLIGVSLVAAGGFFIADGLRAFVGGEGRYAKSQKEAVIALADFARSADVPYFSLYERHIRSPISYRHARELLEAGSSDLDRISGFLVAGGSSPADAAKMVWLFRWFHQTHFFQPALETWRTGDALVGQLTEAATELRDLVEGGGDRTRIDEKLTEIRRIDQDLTELEIRFSDQLGHSARAVESILYTVVGGLALLLSVCAAGFTAYATGRLRVAAREAAQRERRFEDILEVSADWVWETDPEYRFSFLSERLEVVTGLNRSFFMGRRRWECSADPDADYWAPHKTDIEAVRPFQNFEYRVTDKSGRQRTFRVSGKPVFAEDGRLLGYRGTGSDVTTEVESLQQLALETELLEATLENIGHGVGVIDKDLTVVAMNSLLFDLIDLPRDRFEVGSRFEDVIRFNCERGEYGDVDVDDHVASIVETCRKFEPHSFVRVRPDGRILQVRGQPLPSGGLVTTYYDVTAEHRANEALQLSERRIREIIQTALDSFVSFDETGTVTDWNLAAEKTFGWSHSEACGANLATLLEVDDAAAFLAHLTDAQTERGTRHKVHCRSRAGEDLVVEVAVTPQLGGEMPVYNAFVRDLTHQSRFESVLLEAKREAEQANAAKSEFLATMSHELRTPLNAIIGFSELMAERTLGPIPRQYEDYPGLIRTSGQHLLSLINDILDISRIEAGRYELRQVPVRPFDVASQCLELVGIRAEQSGLKLVNQVPIDIPEIFADERCVRQVLINLLGNAVKFSNQGGTIAVGADLTTEGLEISVIDQGKGIPANQLTRVLEPFQQVEGSYSRQAEGAGLGLALVKRFMALHDGTVTLASVEGEGTTVTVLFPRSRLVQEEPRRITG
ncbi:MAG: PAS-domain containing protein [Alphaproteobacteria bacterium]